MKRSAGILVYKKEENDVKVLLCHFGGPYWENIDAGGWSFSKGEVINDESALDAAKREFKEETNLEVKSEIYYLGSKKISRKKLAIMFYTESDFDLSNCQSNYFEMDFPRGSSKIESFPEMDRYEWMDIGKARKMLVGSQVCFLDKLEEKLGNIHWADKC